MVVDPGIPSEIHYSPGGNSAAELDVTNSAKVNFAIQVVFAQMTAQSWSKFHKEHAFTHFQLALPVVNRLGFASQIILYFRGFAFQMYNPSEGDPDPTGALIGSSIGTAINIGVAVASTMTQSDVINQLVLAMRANQQAPEYWDIFAVDPVEDLESPFFGVPTRLLIKAKPDADGPDPNDDPMEGQLLGGGRFDSNPKYGGYNMKSPPANGDSSIRVKFVNDINSNFRFQCEFMTGPRGNPVSDIANSLLPEQVLHVRSNFYSLVGWHQWCVFPLAYGATPAGNIDQVIIGVDDYWICNPFIPVGLRFNAAAPEKEISYCGFMMCSDRTRLNEPNICATCISDKFTNSQFAVPDTGVSLMPLNSMGTREGALTTTSDVALTISPILGLSPGNSFFNREHGLPYVLKPLAVVGYLWDSFMVTKASSLNSTVRWKDGFKYVAYRMQRAPCEVTLWMQFT